MDTEVAALLTGNALSVFGNYFELVAVAALTYQVSHAAWWMSLQFAAGFAVSIAAAPWAGRCVDRARDRRRLMVAADMARAVIAFLLALTHRPWHLVFLIAAGSVGDAFFGTARAALAVQVFGRDRVSFWNGLRSVTAGVCRLAGPLVAGLVVRHLGVGPAFALNAAGYLASAAAVLAVRPRLRQLDGAAGTNDWRTGYRSLLGDPLLRDAIALRTWALIGQWGTNTVWFVWVQAARFGGAGLMGSAIAVYEAGSLLAGAVLPRLARRAHLAVLVAVALVEALCWCVYPWAGTGAMVLALSAVEGACSWILMLLITTLVQQRVQDAGLGAALAAEGQIDAAGHLVGVGAAGFISPWVPLPLCFPVMALLAGAGFAATRIGLRLWRAGNGQQFCCETPTAEPRCTGMGG